MTYKNLIPFQNRLREGDKVILSDFKDNSRNGEYVVVKIKDESGVYSNELKKV